MTKTTSRWIQAAYEEAIEFFIVKREFKATSKIPRPKLQDQRRKYPEKRRDRIKNYTDTIPYAPKFKPSISPREQPRV